MEGKEAGEGTSSSEGDNSLDVSWEEVVTEEVTGLVVALTMDVNMVFAIPKSSEHRRARWRG
jgi:hypothetical protein